MAELEQLTAENGQTVAFMPFYGSIEEAGEYHSKRTTASKWENLDELEKERRLTSASDFLDVNYHFKGHKAEPLQVRAFPRVLSENGLEIVFFPEVIRFAVYQLALIDDLTENSDQEMESVSVGAISVKYKASGFTGQSKKRFEYVEMLLKDWINKGLKGVLLRG